MSLNKRVALQWRYCVGYMQRRSLFMINNIIKYIGHNNNNNIKIKLLLLPMLRNVKMMYSTGSGDYCMRGIFELERVEENCFRSNESDLIRGRQSMRAVYGGQVLGQSLYAASCTLISTEFLPHSLHSYFIKSASVQSPIVYRIENVRDGRSFCTKCVKAFQNDQIIYIAQISYHKQEKDSIRHQLAMPNVTKPEHLQEISSLMRNYISDNDQIERFHQRVIKHKIHDLLPTVTSLFEVRPVNADRYLFKQFRDSDHISPFYVWLKTKEKLGDDVRLRGAMAAYVSDSMMMETTLLSHFYKRFVPSMVFSLDHSIWFHQASIFNDNWTLFEIQSPFAGGSRAFSTGRLWSREGDLMCSIAQEGVVRESL